MSFDAQATAALRDPPSAYNPLPDMTHLTYKDFENVYEPREDSDLFLDVLKREFGGSTSPSTPLSQITEVGCGSGIISVGLALLLMQMDPEPSISMTLTDVNPHALTAAQGTIAKNGFDTADCQIKFRSFLSDVTDPSSALPPSDVILFNPPYVPTPSDEIYFLGSGSSESDTANDVKNDKNDGTANDNFYSAGDAISAAWAGGTDGREVLDLALPRIKRSLNRPHGVLYLVLVDDNDPQEVCDWWTRGGHSPRMESSFKNSSKIRDSKHPQYVMESGGGWSVVGRRIAKNEKLSILRLHL